jgi:hypothetical protein
MIEFSDLKNMSKAYIKVCKEIKNPNKNKKGVHNAAYADLDQVIEVSKSVLAENGFSIIQYPNSGDDRIGITTMLLHESGEYIKGEFNVKFQSQDPQKVGGAITYYRRYSLVSMLNLVGENDDDADSISEHAKSVANKKPTIKQLNALYYKVTENNCSVDDYNNIIKPNIDLTMYKSFMDNFTTERFNKAVVHFKNQNNK